MAKRMMIYDTDPWLKPYKAAIDSRHARILEAAARLGRGGSLADGINNHLYYGLHRNFRL